MKEELSKEPSKELPKDLLIFKRFPANKSNVAL